MPTKEQKLTVQLVMERKERNSTQPLRKRSRGSKNHGYYKKHWILKVGNISYDRNVYGNGYVMWQQYAANTSLEKKVAN